MLFRSDLLGTWRNPSAFTRVPTPYQKTAAADRKELGSERPPGVAGFSVTMEKDDDRSGTTGADENIRARRACDCLPFKCRGQRGLRDGGVCGYQYAERNCGEAPSDHDVSCQAARQPLVRGQPQMAILRDS